MVKDRKLPLRTYERGVCTSIEPYFQVFKKRPRGMGVYAFLIGENHYYITNDYYKARRQAMGIARKMGIYEIQLMNGVAL